jgi:hypothetical protein
MSSDSSNDPGDEKPDAPRDRDGATSLESQLWNLDDDEPFRPVPKELLGAVGEEIPPVKLSRAPRIVTAKVIDKKIPLGHEAPVKQEDHGIKLNVMRNQDLRPNERPVRRLDLLREFGDLEQWADDGGKATGREAEEAKMLTQIEASSEPAAPVSNDVPQAENPKGNFVGAAETSVERVPAAESNEPVGSEAEEVPATSGDTVEVGAPSVIKRQAKYSALEKFGLLVLVLLLLGVAAGFLFYTASRLPVESLSSKVPKFPLKGQHVAIESAKTYWRDVVTRGPDADIVRRGTRLLPVLDLNCSGGDGVLRVLFRDEFGDSVGDIITRQISAGEKVSIASTAGFNDAGMHAAYRTGETKVWRIEVYEGSAGNSLGNDFVKLFEIDISTERR